MSAVEAVESSAGWRSADNQTPTSVRVAVVLYGNSLADIWRCYRSLRQSVNAAVADPDTVLNSVDIRFGDCSDHPVLSPADVEALRAAGEAHCRVDYRWFGRNLGHSAGSNALAEGAPEDAVLFLNPDTYCSPLMLTRMLAAMRSPETVAVDARQIPCEHAKWYDPVTGVQSWASGACLLVRTPWFRDVGGFDAQTFPSYVNDVDLSWRLRLAGGTVAHAPGAVVFHDKRLDDKAGVRPTRIEFYAGLLGRLLLATRYDRPDIVAETIDIVGAHGNSEQKRAVAEFERLRDACLLPDPLPGAASVAEFIDGEYGRRRY
ncbi:glycosyltransferase [Actinokineospora sp. UTMC 2448]|uniref:glycosyltransferase n=1 Tax=Actinokineospora sp. UTMC 2448 TaxID=2268449 RepID=UPI0021644C42|nr:glycosyltransferase family 2 protein [Actinokineospora sp. UTMC 2448]UVS76390.1 N-acetylglucosaminyl-diphospho-decaprenol L-rhamnosyltransferase [Actinokineospora sp. UTMC 2448]